VVGGNRADARVFADCTTLETLALDIEALRGTIVVIFLLATCRAAFALVQRAVALQMIHFSFTST
jgi:hypothetical protein